MSDSFDKIAQDARAELRERLDEIDNGDEPHDLILEIADSSTPIYYSDIFATLADPRVWSGDYNMDSGLIEGVTELDKIAQAYIFVAIEAEVWEEWRLIEEERAEAEEDDS
jgi:hypothetical protein